MEIIKICENICDTPIIKLRFHYIYTLPKLEEEMLHVR